MSYDVVLFVLVSGGLLGVAQRLGQRRFLDLAPRLLLAAAALRIAGAWARQQVIVQLYGGLGDAFRYYNDGLDLRDAVLSGNLSLISAEYWLETSARWGTQLIVQVSGVVLTLIGPAVSAEFVVFAVFGFAGILLVLAAFRRSYGLGTAYSTYAGWVLLWPSLWFWPSSIGKESILLLAIGLVTLGYVGRDGRVAWVTWLAGVSLAYLLRPHIAALACLSTVLAQWLGREGRFTWRRALEMVAGAAAAVVGMSWMLQRYGIDPDLEGVTEFIQYTAGQTLQGGSQVGATSLDAAGLGVAFLNVWARPFIWEAHNLTSMISALEMTAFLALLLVHRRQVLAGLRNWRGSRLVSFALPFLMGYTVMIGLAFGNLGIIARQRAPMFPFMFAVVAHGLAVAPVSKRAAVQTAPRVPLPSGT